MCSDDSGRTGPNGDSAADRAVDAGTARAQDLTHQ